MPLRIAKVTVLLIGVYYVAGVIGLCVPVLERAEREASLFDNTRYRHVNATVDSTSESLDVRSTVRKWSQDHARSIALRTAESISSIRDLVAFTSTAYADDTPTSVLDEKGKGTITCSTQGEKLACSADSGADGPVGCSVGAANTNACSTSGPARDDGIDTHCSTSGGGTGSGTATCSVNVDASEDGSGQDNTTCSASGSDGGNMQCSAGGDTKAVGCSTAGGQSLGDNANGTAACSAAGFDHQDGVQCSATGGDATAKCSTFMGEHEACSAGRADQGKSAKCSAMGNSDEGKSASCSVFEPPPSGKFDNKCSAVSYPSATPGNSRCSSDQASGNGSDGKCSVFGAAGDKDSNAACSATPDENGNPAPTQYYCSADVNNTGNNITNNSCSVFDDDGGFKSGPGTNGMCGDSSLEGHHPSQ